MHTWTSSELIWLSNPLFSCSRNSFRDLNSCKQSIRIQPCYCGSDKTLSLSIISPSRCPDLTAAFSADLSLVLSDSFSMDSELIYMAVASYHESCHMIDDISKVLHKLTRQMIRFSLGAWCKDPWKEKISLPRFSERSTKNWLGFAEIFFHHFPQSIIIFLELNQLQLTGNDLKGATLRTSKTKPLAEAFRSKLW